MKKPSKHLALLGGGWLCLYALFASYSVANEVLEQVLLDIQQLSSEAKQGRETGTEGAALTRDWLKQRFAELDVASWQDSYAAPFRYRQGRHTKEGVNLQGWLPGCPDAPGYIVISAHYDHLGKRGRRIYPGANDNASGVAAMLALIRQLQQLDAPCRAYHYILLATDAEENGLHGSAAFVRQPPVALEQIVLNINLDMLARSEPRGQLFITGARRVPGLRTHLQQHQGQLRLVFLTDRGPLQAGSLQPLYDWRNSSDHAYFHRAGIPYLFFGGMPFTDYHSPNDQWQRIDAEFLNQVMTIIGQTILWLENETDVLGLSSDSN